MKRVPRIAVVPVSLLLLTQPMHAQNASSATVGARVRVSTATFHRQPMALVERGSDSIAFRTPRGDTLRLHVSQVQTLELSHGRRTRKAKGAVIGFLIGAGIGGSLAFAAESSSDSFLKMPGLAAAVGGVLGGAVGAGAGAIVGAIPREKWRQIPVQ